MENSLLLRIHITDDLFTTVPYDWCELDEEKVTINLENGMKQSFDRSRIKFLEIISLEAIA